MLISFKYIIILLLYSANEEQLCIKRGCTLSQITRTNFCMLGLAYFKKMEAVRTRHGQIFSSL